MNEIRVPFDTMKQKLQHILITKGFTPDRAALCARLFTETTCDGIYSHGINRFPRFIEYIDKGIIRVHAKPEKIASLGAVEKWDGRSGPGNTNAWMAMSRAMSLASEHGSGIVAMRNTNHWMRGGTYGWQAIEKGFMAICFTNTKPNMPPWGGVNPAVGNNPLILAVPDDEKPVVLDMAMSQYSFGKLELLNKDDQQTTFPCGFDDSSKLTNEPGTVLKNERSLPAGYWKGSGLAMLLDLFAAVLSEGNTTADIGRQEVESNVSQVFMAFDLSKITSKSVLSATVKRVINDVEQSGDDPDNKVRYPGRNILAVRSENKKNGIPVDKSLWERITREKRKF
ncbi:MAG TPA: 3-dehydro-L-gulonate 2-dehydrogenase [Bacteroidales bacterium]|nr:3-dehydro-L-gulonate 2-dehydrogenase [Bacteroidales bacterium]